MPTREKILSLLDILQPDRYDLIEDYIIQISKTDFPDIEDRLDDLEIDFDSFGNEYLRFEIFELGEFVYVDEPHFLRENRNLNEDLLDKNVHIINTEYGYLNYQEEENTINSDGDRVEIYLVENYYYYISFFKLFKDSNIVDFDNDLDKELYIITADEPAFIVGYTSPIKKVKKYPLKDSIITGFESVISRKSIHPHFKEALINNLRNIDKKARFYELFEKFEAILTDAEREYEIFTKQFSFKKLKKDLRREKEKYFSSIRDIIDKLLNKVVAIPISVSAAAFALYRLKNESLLGIFVIGAFLIYSIFSYYLIDLIKKENQDIEKQFNLDLDIIQRDSGLPDEELEPVREVIERRINVLFTSIKILKGILVIISIGLIVIALNQYEILLASEGVLIIAGIIALLALLWISLSDIPYSYF